MLKMRIKESGFYIKAVFFLGFGGRKIIDSSKTVNLISAWTHIL